MTAPIEQQQPVAQPIGVAPEAPQPTTEPKTGMLRRAIGWLNAPVLPESDPAAVAPAAEPVVAQATAAPVMMEQPALMEQPVMVQQPVVQQPVVQQQVMAQPAAMAQAAVMTEPVVPQPTAQPVMAQPQVMTQPVMAQPVVQQPVVQQQVMQPVVETTAPVQVQPIQTQPVQTTAQTPAAQSSLDELIAAQQAQFQAWLAIQQNATPAAPEAAVATPVQPATASVQPATQPVAPLANLTEATTTSALTDDGATPARTLADALPTWPSENMHYGDVHTALFGEDTDAPASTAMSMVEVDLQAIDAVVEQEDTPDLGTGATRYAPFLMRALCMAAQEFNGTDQPVHISVNGTGLDDRRIENAHDKRLSALTRELSDDASADQSQPEPTVAINLSSSLGGHLSVEIGDGQVPTVSLVYLSKRPIATRDRLGCTAITTHSMGLLSVAASTTPTRADQYLDLVRDILETRDWTTELD